MIGTIIIAVTGYGVVILLLLAVISHFQDVRREPAGSLKERRAAGDLLSCLGLAVLIAVITRWLAGV